MAEIPINRRSLGSELYFEGNRLTPEQITAIKLSIELGKILRDEHPEIKNLYTIQNLSQPDIAKKLNVQEEYLIVGDNVAARGVGKALTGHRGGFGIEPYTGLITNEEELRQLKLEHIMKYSRQTIQREYEEGIGIFALSTEERRAAGRKGAEKGAVKGGKKTYEEGKGVHALSMEEKIEAGRKGAIARGLYPYSSAEIFEAYKLSSDPKYQNKKGRNRGPMWQKIMEYLNLTYHGGEPVRDKVSSISARIRDYQNKLNK